MPIKIWIEKKRRRVRAVVTEKVSINDIIESINKAIKDPDFSPGFNILSDHTTITKAIETEAVQMTAFYVKGISKNFIGSRWAVVTVSDASFGMMRMLSVLLGDTPIELQVFRSFKEAEKWLDAPPNEQ